MACGKRFHASDATIVASKSLACGTTVWLTNPATGKVVPATVQDRGPFVKGRDLDASRALARALGYERQGTATLDVSYTAPSTLPTPETIPADGWTNANDMNLPTS
jgi:rare lipoprotein A